jgi:hypothetical protein
MTGRKVKYSGSPAATVIGAPVNHGASDPAPAHVKLPSWPATASPPSTESSASGGKAIDPGSPDPLPGDAGGLPDVDGPDGVAVGVAAVDGVQPATRTRSTIIVAPKRPGRPKTG